MPDAFGFCVYKLSGAFQSVDEVERFCPQSGTWEDECRHAWVAGHTHDTARYPTADLVKACGGNIDCAFETLDLRPDPDVLVQMQRCADWTGRFAHDCAGHSLQRWWRTNPDAAEVARVAAASTHAPDEVGRYVALRMSCGGVGACTGDPAVVTACTAALAELSGHPEKCTQLTSAQTPVTSGYPPPPQRPVPPQGPHP